MICDSLNRLVRMGASQVVLHRESGYRCTDILGLPQRDDAESCAVAPSNSDRSNPWVRLRSALFQPMNEHYQLKCAAALMVELRTAPVEVASLHLAAAERYLPPVGGDGRAIT